MYKNRNIKNLPKGPFSQKLAYIITSDVVVKCWYRFLVAWLWAGEETLDWWGITYLPSTVWSIRIPSACLCLFVAAPLLYGALNGLAAPRLDSLDSLQDKYTRRRQKATLATEAVEK